MDTEKLIKKVNELKEKYSLELDKLRQEDNIARNEFYEKMELVEDKEEQERLETSEDYRQLMNSILRTRYNDTISDLTNLIVDFLLEEMKELE